jgi:hypothetical protein
MSTDNIARARAHLDKHRVMHEVFNGGQHLKIRHKGEAIDFWPSTGKWSGGKTQNTLYAYLGIPEETAPARASRRITARYKSTCSCGTSVQPGEDIEWDPGTRLTVGCRTCSYTGEDPAPGDHGDGGFSDEDYPIFHDKW